MATVNYSSEKPAPGVLVITWEGLEGADVGQVVQIPYYPDKCVQFGPSGGDTHGGATTVLQGSNDPVALSDPDNATWHTLADPQGNALSVTTSPGIEQVLENPRFIRPSQSGGTSGDYDIILTCKGDPSSNPAGVI